MNQKLNSSSKNSEEETPRWRSELKGFLLLVAVFLVWLCLWSFDTEAPNGPWMGLLGTLLGGTLHFLFGIGSYFVLGYGAWVGWAYLTHRPSPAAGLKPIYFASFLFSFCILASLLEEQFPSITEWGGKAYGYYYSRNFPSFYPLHLGGTPFHLITYQIPGINLLHLLNKVGTGILFSSLLIASGLLLTETSTISFFLWLKSKIIPKKETFSTSNLKETSSLRLVKLKSSTEHNEEGISNQEFIPIQPALDPKIRPSVSKKINTEERKSVEDRKSPHGVIWPEIKRSSKEPSTKEVEPEIVTPSLPRVGLKAPEIKNPPKTIPGDFKNYKIPPISLLTDPVKLDQSQLKKGLSKQAEVLEETLLSFGIEAKVGQINCGPTITSFEVHPAIGVKVQKIKTLENDIALNMEAKSIRIIAPIPGKAAVGIEVPNPKPQEVGFKDMIQNYLKSSQKYRLPMLLGKNVSGDFVMSDLAKMPHCIIAGATGSGKSVCINTLVMSILMTARPDEIRLLMVDPKKVELTPYSMLPHMLCPVITEPQEACAALNWLVKEMDLRYELLKELQVRNIDGYNSRTINSATEKEIAQKLNRPVPDKLPYFIGIIDELADLMMVSNQDIETPIARIAQMARAVGIHLILATQRPSREVITGLIKANFPTRISFKVASRVNSQIILDDTGAESLLGNGDMLFLPPGSSHLVRAQGAFIRDEDINKVIRFICEQTPPNYITQSFEALGLAGEMIGKANEMELDSLYNDAYNIIISTGNASTTFLQRKLKVGYARAASLMDQLQAQGVIGPADGSKPRRILADLGNDEDV